MAQIKTLTLFSVTTKCKPKNSVHKWNLRKKNLETGFYRYAKTIPEYFRRLP